MKHTFINGIGKAVAVACLSVGLAAAQTATDNSKMNKRDASKMAKTADNAGGSKNDREIMQKIRQAVMAEKSLSTYAHNVKIISKGGMVTLKGPVRSEEEKTTIEAKAKEVAGADKVTDQITVAPGKSKAKSTK